MAHKLFKAPGDGHTPNVQVFNRSEGPDREVDAVGAAARAKVSDGNIDMLAVV